MLKNRIIFQVDALVSFIEKLKKDIPDKEEYAQLYFLYISVLMDLFTFKERVNEFFCKVGDLDVK